MNMRYMTPLIVVALLLSGCAPLLNGQTMTGKLKLEVAIENAKTVLEACSLALELYQDLGKPEDAEKIISLQRRILIVQNYLDRLLDEGISAADPPPWEDEDW